MNEATTNLPPPLVSQYQSTGLQDGNYFRSHYSNIRLLKRAIYGQVHLCVHHATQQQVAIKVIHPKSVLLVRQQKARGELPKEDWMKELEAMRTLQNVGGHPSVVRLLEDFEENGAVFIVMEFCNGGEMFDMLGNLGNQQQWNPKVIFRKYMEGVLFLHSMDICHRDLSLENTLYHSDYGPKICDFGGCIPYDVRGIDGGLVMRDNKGRDQHVHRVGKQFYMSPQILNHQQYDGKCTDIWSCGVFLFLLMTSHPPWEYAHLTHDTSGAFRTYIQGGPEAFKQLVHEWNLLHSFDEACWELLMLLLQPEEQHRCTAIDALDHAWLKEGKDDEDRVMKMVEKGEGGEVKTASSIMWTCTTWESMTCNQQSRLRYLFDMSNRHGSEYPPLMRALDSTALRSGWTNDQLTAALHQMNGTGTKENQQRCSVS